MKIWESIFKWGTYSQAWFVVFERVVMIQTRWVERRLNRLSFLQYGGGQGERQTLCLKSNWRTNKNNPGMSCVFKRCVIHTNGCLLISDVVKVHSSYAQSLSASELLAFDDSHRKQSIKHTIINLPEVPWLDWVKQISFAHLCCLITNNSVLV